MRELHQISLEELQTLSEKYLMPTYKRLPIAFERGEGCKLWDINGKEYLDFLSGIAVNNLGHCHPKVVAAICAQAGKLLHTSNLYLIEPQIRLAELLIKNSFPGKVFFCNSGAEANEAAIKLVRKWGQPQGKHKIITAWQSFHGRTLTTISATGQEKYQKYFTPLTPGFSHVPFNDLAALEKAIDQQTAAIMLEPVQAEGGVNIPAADYLEKVRALCDKKGLLLVLDEVQTGLGRMGKLFAFQHTNIIPDIMTLAKGLGSGMPIGAALAQQKIADTFQPGDHAATFGGNFLAARAALTTLEVILAEDICASAADMGNYLVKRLKDIHSPLIKDVSGLGLLVRMELSVPGQPIVNACLEQGLIINCVQEKVLRFVPPLIVSKAEIDEAVEILEGTLK